VPHQCVLCGRLYHRPDRRYSLLAILRTHWLRPPWHPGVFLKPPRIQANTAGSRAPQKFRYPSTWTVEHRHRVEGACVRSPIAHAHEHHCIGRVQIRMLVAREVGKFMLKGKAQPIVVHPLGRPAIANCENDGQAQF